MRMRDLLTEGKFDDIAMSLHSLMKTNNGLFKSEKQAKFILSQVPDMELVTGGDMYGNTFTQFYKLDDKGVVSWIKYLPRTGKEVLQWERPVAGKKAIQDATAEKKQARHATKSIKDAHGVIDGFADRLKGHTAEGTLHGGMVAYIYSELLRAQRTLINAGESYDIDATRKEAIEQIYSAYKPQFDEIIEQANIIKDKLVRFKDEEDLVPFYNKKLQGYRTRYQQLKDAVQEEISEIQNI
jgi:hypothetical protein